MIEIAPVIEGGLLDEGLVLGLFFHDRSVEHLENTALAQRGKIDREYGGVVRRQPRQRSFGREVPRLEVDYRADRAQPYGENGTDEESAFHRDRRPHGYTAAATSRARDSFHKLM